MFSHLGLSANSVWITDSNPKVIDVDSLCLYNVELSNGTNAHWGYEKFRIFWFGWQSSLLKGSKSSHTSGFSMRRTLTSSDDVNQPRPEERALGVNFPGCVPVVCELLLPILCLAHSYSISSVRAPPPPPPNSRSFSLSLSVSIHSATASAEAAIKRLDSSNIMPVDI